MDRKGKLASFDRTGLLSLIQDFWGVHKDNPVFLHARLDLGEDILVPYNEAIDRWLWPAVFSELGYVGR